MAKKDQHFAECFSEPPFTAFRRPKNLRELFIKAEVPSPPNLRPERNIKGMKRCRKQCPYVRSSQESQDKQKKDMANKQKT